MGNNDKKEIIEIVHVAWRELEQGNLARALDTLHTVESRAAGFASFFVVKASALLEHGDFRQAADSSSKALELAPDSPHAQLILAVAEERMNTTSVPAPERRTLAHFLDPLAEQEPEAPLAAQFDLDRTADELTRERPLVKPVLEPSERVEQLPDLEEQPGLVSETLAEIMIRQGKLTDAKKVYIQLSRLQPSRYEYFKSKIEAIDNLVLGTGIVAPHTQNDNDQKGQNE